MKIGLLLVIASLSILSTAAMASGRTTHCKIYDGFGEKKKLYDAWSSPAGAPGGFEGELGDKYPGVILKLKQPFGPQWDSAHILLMRNSKVLQVASSHQLSKNDYKFDLELYSADLGVSIHCYSEDSK